MKYNLKEDQLKMHCINLSDEIKKDDDLLNNKDVTIFNSSILPIKNKDDYLIASRGWFGNIRSWDGINFVILSVFGMPIINELVSFILDTGTIDIILSIFIWFNVILCFHGSI